VTSATANTDRLLLYFGAAKKLARYMLRNEADAEDVVQEAFLRALRYRGSAPAGDSPAWMLTVVRNVGYDWLRRSRRAARDSEFVDLERIQAEGPSPEAILIAKRNAESIRNSLDRLPARFKTVVILRGLGQMSYGEIAEQTGIPIGTVMSRLARGRAHLQTLLAEYSRVAANCSQGPERRQPNQ
jgi:RNA polymerase sigma factor (sigma-70 family)